MNFGGLDKRNPGGFGEEAGLFCARISGLFGKEVELPLRRQPWGHLSTTNPHEQQVGLVS